MPVVKNRDPLLADRLIDRGAELLAEEGPGGLSLRRLAADAGTSTMAVYTLFGDKRGLLLAMFREGFARLAATIAQRPRDRDPLADLAQIGLAYRRFALANAHLYTLMFGPRIAGLTVDDRSERAARATYTALVDGVARAVASGALIGEVAIIAAQLWAVSHGMVSLDIAGQLPGTGLDPEAAYATALTYAVGPFSAPADRGRGGVRHAAAQRLRRQTPAG